MSRGSARMSCLYGQDASLARRVDPTTHRVYFPLENVGGRPVLRVMDARVATASP